MEYPHGFVGAFYAIHSNMIVINKRPLARLMQTNPNLYKHYVFHVMLHEYVHSVGFTDENEARKVVYDMTLNYFGERHALTFMASDITQFVPLLAHPENRHVEPEDINIEFVRGIDRRNINYIN